MWHILYHAPAVQASFHASHPQLMRSAHGLVKLACSISTGCAVGTKLACSVSTGCAVRTTLRVQALLPSKPPSSFAATLLAASAGTSALAATSMTEQWVRTVCMCAMSVCVCVP